MTAPEILRMATVGGADALRGRTWGTWRRDAGRLLPLRPAACEVDAAARSDLDAGLHGGEQNVVTTVAAGRVVLEDGKIVTANERELLERAQDAARAAGAAGGHQVVGTSLTRPYRVARSSSPARCRATWRGTSPRATRSVFRPWRRGGGRRPEDRVEEGAQVGLRAGVVDDAGPQHEPGRPGWSGSRMPRRRLDRLHDRLVQGVQGGRVVAEGGRSVARADHRAGRGQHFGVVRLFDHLPEPAGQRVAADDMPEPGRRGQQQGRPELEGAEAARLLEAVLGVPGQPAEPLALPRCAGTAGPG